MKLRLLLCVLIFGACAAHAQAPTYAWKMMLGGTLPQLMSGDIYPDNTRNYGGFIALENDFSEHTGLRLQGKFISMNSKNPAYNYIGSSIRTSMSVGNVDIIYRITPCEPVVPYVSVGMGGYYFKLDTKIPVPIVDQQLKDGDFDTQFNLGVGAEWKFNNKIALITDFGYHTASSSRLEGFRGSNGGFLGDRYDAYMTISIGMSFTLWQGERSHLNDAYTGIKIPQPAPPVIPERVDYARIEEMIKANTPVAEKIDYTRLQEMIRSNKPVIRQPERVIIEKKASVAFEMINFSSGSIKLDREAINSLNRAVAILNDNTELVVELQGHTDNVGSATINKKLSGQRAAAVKQYLLNKGIAESRLKVAVLQTEAPVGDNTTTDGRALNRRVELKILNK